MIKLVLGVILFATVLFFTSHVMKDNTIQGRLNIVNGYASECMMHQFYTSAGWMKMEGEVILPKTQSFQK